MIQYVKFGHNPSFDSRYRVLTSFFWSKLDIKSAGVTLKIRSRSLKSNHFFLMSQWCSRASLVIIHQLVQEIECRKGTFFTVFIVRWPWKLCQSQQNLINSFNYPSDTKHKVWPEIIIWFKRQGADKRFWSKFDIQSAGVTLKIRSRSLKSNHFFPMFHWCFCTGFVSKSIYWCRRQSADKAHFYSLYSVVTFKIR